MPYRARSHFSSHRTVRRTPEQQAAHNALFERVMGRYVQEATYKGPPIGVIVAAGLITVIALVAWIATK